MIARFLLGFALFTVCFIGLIESIEMLTTIDEIIILAALFLVFLSYSLLCEAAIERIAKSINKMKRRRLE